MCSNRGLTDRIVCCMDDLVECFEDYVTKSLIAIWIALGIIVASVVYLLKIVSERTLDISPSIPNTSSIRLPRNENTNIRSIKQEKQGRRKLQSEARTESKPRRDIIVKENYLMTGNQDKQISTSEINRARSVPSFDESILREVGLTCCSKPCCLSKKKSQELHQSRYEQIPQRPQQDIEPKSRISNPAAPMSLNSPKRSLQSLPICSKSNSKGSCCSMCVKQEPRDENM